MNGWLTAGARAMVFALLLALGCAGGPEGSARALPLASETATTSPPPNLGPITPRAGSGPLMVVGGGKIPDAVRARFIELAGGPEAQILIFPQASEREDAGSGHLKAWKESGANNVAIAELIDPVRIARDLVRADAIWFGGGSQNRLMAALEAAECVEALRRRHQQGCVFGGTSAGAAVMSQAMLTGDAHTDRLEPGTTVIGKGLGLWPGVIVDQHFLRRRRFLRLFAAVLDTPELVGVGIDEGTAVLVEDGSWEVIGGSPVLVIDARGAEVWDAEVSDTEVSDAEVSDAEVSDAEVSDAEVSDAGVNEERAPFRAEDVRLHALPPGVRWVAR